MISFLSRPTSSSSASRPSPPLVHPSSSSSSLSLSSGSSTIYSFSVDVVDVPHPVKVLQGDDPANAVDRSDSPKQAISRVEFSWADLKVTGLPPPSRPRNLSLSFWGGSRFWRRMLQLPFDLVTITTLGNQVVYRASRINLTDRSFLASALATIQVKKKKQICVLWQSKKVKQAV